MELLITNAIKLLKDLITMESFSFNEDKSVTNTFASSSINICICERETVESPLITISLSLAFPILIILLYYKLV